MRAFTLAAMIKSVTYLFTYQYQATEPLPRFVISSASYITAFVLLSAFGETGGSIQRSEVESQPVQRWIRTLNFALSFLPFTARRLERFWCR